MEHFNKSSAMVRAELYLKAGFHLVVLRPPVEGEPSPGKRPATPRGVHDATNSLATFRRATSAMEQWNIGIATGAISNIVVVDVDPRNGGDVTIKELEKSLGKLPKTARVNTGGGGWHLYFRAPKGSLRKCTLGDGVDLLGDGAYAVAPPSLHTSTRRYRWVKKRRFSDGMKTLPRAWVEFCRRDRKTNAADVIASVDIPEGKRNTTLTELAGRLRRSGLDEESLAVSLRSINAARCTPPLREEEVAQIARSVASYSVTDEGGLDEAERIANAFLVGYQKGEHLRAEADGRFWRWASTHWMPVEDEWLKGQLLKVATAQQVKGRKRGLADETFALLRMKLRRDDDLLGFTGNPKPVINVLNGEIWLSQDGSYELRPHDLELTRFGGHL